MRYGISLFTMSMTRGTFPFGTLVVNLAGSFVIGMLWGLAETGYFSPRMRIFIFTGLLGAFTTFSTYSLETVHLLRDNEIRAALANIGLSNVIGIGLAFLGYAVSRRIYFS